MEHEEAEVATAEVPWDQSELDTASQHSTEEASPELDSGARDASKNVAGDDWSLIGQQGASVVDNEPSEPSTEDQDPCVEAPQEPIDDNNSRRASHRTEALILAAARDIVAQLGNGGRKSATQDSAVAGSESEAARARYSHGADTAAPDQTSVSNDDEPHTVTPDEAGDSSSHHENDDVFSDDSPRSSMGSMSEAELTKIEQTLSQRNITQRARSPRISDIPQSDPEEDFVPTARATPRQPFRSPSSVQAMQLSSPPVSVLGVARRTSRRTPLPTVSRLGSPSVSAQYSPKKTPPRFKRATPPLVLLHVTLLPLRWSWGHVLDSAPTSDLSPQARSLREAWRQLQDRTGDTVSDRGILLPHPQNDYEVLEERLLEALELPLRRRARILQCGHYLGSANDMSLPEDDMDIEDDEHANGPRSPRASLDKKHWCRTCRSEIRFESLGQGRVFRVKVYASNGLMKAGAWEACWKEMERVDVELDPIVDANLQGELASLAEQDRALKLQEAMQEEELGEEEDDGEEQESFISRAQSREHDVRPSPQPEVCHDSSSAPEDGGAQDEGGALGDIYGHTPRGHAEAPSSRARQTDFDEHEHEPPRSPCDEALEQRAERRRSRTSSSLLELVLEALAVLVQDKKNVIIGLLSILIAILVARVGGPHHDPPVEALVEQSAVAVAPSNLEDWTPSGTMMEAMAAAVDPCVSCSASLAAAELAARDVPTSTLRIVETVTATVVETLTETVSVELAPTQSALVSAGLFPTHTEDEDVLAEYTPTFMEDNSVEVSQTPIEDVSVEDAPTLIEDEHGLENLAPAQVDSVSGDVSSPQE